MVFWSLPKKLSVFGFSVRSGPSWEVFVGSWLSVLQSRGLRLGLTR